MDRRMEIETRRRGTTLAELVVLLGLVGIVIALTAPVSRAALDRGAVVAAREEAMGLVHRARALALAGGGATLRVMQGSELLLLLDGGGRVRERVEFGPAGIDLRTTGSAEQVEMTWNALGWGRVTSRTLELRRGHATARLVVSARGRAERR